ncbi:MULTISPECIES: porin [Ponticoccus]|uniref:Porin n=1 Tax=Ponticoccus litoralis TaxID=422297 RepID=A0AAW9SC94_9RHOB
MKNILFATTALVAVAGAAAAEVTITGSAELGLVQNENGSGDAYTGDLSETQVFTDIDVTFSMTGEADNGLTFGASIDLDETGNPDPNVDDAARLPDATIFLAYGAARLTVGDTDSAFDARLTETNLAGGSINDDETVHPGWNGHSNFDEFYGGQEIRFDYTFDAFTMSVSTSPDRFKNFDPSYAVGVSYNADLAGLNLALGLGYIQVDEDVLGYDSELGVSVATTFDNGLQAVLNYSKMSDDSSGGLDDGSHWGVGVAYTMNALTLAANYGEYDWDGGDSSGYGLVANYDFGGGLVGQFGYGAGEFSAPGVDYEDTWSLGLAMSF